MPIEGKCAFQRKNHSGWQTYKKDTPKHCTFKKCKLKSLLYWQEISWVISSVSEDTENQDSQGDAGSINLGTFLDGNLTP